MKVTLTITTDNAAFVDLPPERELARILRGAAERVIMKGLNNAQGYLHDVNGNKVGELKVEE